MKGTLCLIFAFIAVTNLNAQEIIVGASPIQNRGNIAKTEISARVTKVAGDTLPFIDDFSDTELYPNPARWEDDNVFVNRTFPLNPPTIGVATLDALNSDGEIYEHAIASAFDADILTSNKIRLDSIFDPIPKALTKNDSIYLSFFFEPGGLGDLPEMSDSLILEFYDSTYFSEDTTYEVWNKVWSTVGISNDTTQTYDSNFVYVMVPINDDKYLQEDFRFRFRNKASINFSQPSWTNNTDYWHIDFVYIDYGRIAKSFSSPELAFVYDSPSFLQEYTSMPYNHYKFANNEETVVKKEIDLYVNNLDENFHSFKTYYEIHLDGNKVFSSPPYGNGFITIPPFAGFSNFPVVLGSNYSVFNHPAGDSVLFEVKHITMEENTGQFNFIRSNDTIVHKQIFYDYYAYDDGSPEAGYGITPSGSILAYEFNSEIKDTLRAVDIFFNRTKNDANKQYFDILIYKDELSSGNIIYLKEDEEVKYEDGVNAFYRYYFEDIYFDNEAQNDENILDGTFYVALRQHSDAIMNIGYDLNNDAGAHTYFNVDGTWQQSIHHGALMMRPVMGKTLAGAPKRIKPEEEEFALSGLKLSPNPCSNNQLRIAFSSFDPEVDYSSLLKVHIYDNTGRRVLETNYQEMINLSNLNTGFYIVKVFNSATNEQFTGKIIIDNSLSN